MLDKITVTPSFNTMSTISELLRNTLDKQAVPKDINISVMVCFDEIFSNIVKFSTASYASVECEKLDNILYLRFTDNGLPFDPLEHEQADTGSEFSERPAGGLGILMVKESADTLRYEYKNGTNILILGFRL